MLRILWGRRRSRVLLADGRRFETYHRVTSEDIAALTQRVNAKAPSNAGSSRRRKLAKLTTIPGTFPRQQQWISLRRQFSVLRIPGGLGVFPVTDTQSLSLEDQAGMIAPEAGGMHQDAVNPAVPW